MSDPGLGTVLVADPRPETLAQLRAILTAAQYSVQVAPTPQEALDLFYSQSPHCVIVRHEMTGPGGRPLLDEFKSDNVYGHLPALVLVLREEVDAGIDWHHAPADDYIIEPLTAEEVVSRIRLSLARAQRDVNANPLTGLPGNLTISREAERRLIAGQPFCFAYLDIDHFKAFNDRYGFSRGDEVLRMTARVIVNSVRALGSRETYVGHVGGDDFVFVTPSDLIKQACKRITADFDLIVRNFYDREDLDRGAIESINRRGQPQTFPLLSVSIGVVDTSVTPIQHMAEMFQRVTEVKSFTKQLPGSNFIIDRRGQ